MSLKYDIISEVKDGEITRNRKMLQDVIKSFEGKTITITIEKAKKKRSNPQNNFLWGIVYPVMQQALKDAGNLMPINDVHELLKLRFLKETIMLNEQTGEVIERVKSTTELSTTGFMDYIAEIQSFAMEYFNTTIPNPTDDITLNFD